MTLMDLARVSVWTLEQGKQGGIDLQKLVSVLRMRLVETGYASNHGRLRQTMASEAFSKCFDRVRELPELSRIAYTPKTAYSQLLAVLQGRGGGLHPLRVASVLAWLYPGSTRFADDYLADRPAVFVSKEAPKKSMQSNVESARKELVARVLAGESLSSSARAVGVEVVTGQAWAAVAGIVVPVRPSIIIGEHRSRIIASLRIGADKTEVEHRFGISASSVNRILRTEVGLHATWKAARQSTCLSRMRASWLDQISAPATGPKYARQLAPAAYAWLYRHDREWLRQVNLANENNPRSNNVRVDWDGRDRSLSQAVLRAALEIHDLRDVPIRLVDILTRVPELKAKMPKLIRLPLTSRALDQVLSSSRRKKA